MRFTKMQGLGNDYIYVNTMVESVENPSKLAQELSDRHFGIGADGLILIGMSGKADVKMLMYNADGSAGMMCGNGIRCVAKYVYDKCIVRKKNISIETFSGTKETEIINENGGKTFVKVNMGQPEVRERNKEINIGKEKYASDYISMGNPHAVLYMKDIEKIKLKEIGSEIECSPVFQERVNVEFAHVIDRNTIKMRVWERGSGETFACGTGACAAAVSAVLNNLTEREVTIKLLGGDLLIQWSKNDGNVYMTGPAVTVFEGEINR